jgi:hypothetical protein
MATRRTVLKNLTPRERRDDYGTSKNSMPP